MLSITASLLFQSAGLVGIGLWNGTLLSAERILTFKMVFELESLNVLLLWRWLSREALIWQTIDCASELDPMFLWDCIHIVFSWLHSIVGALSWLLDRFPCHLLVITSWLKEVFLKINIASQISSLTATRRYSPDYSCLSLPFQSVQQAVSASLHLDLTRGKQWKHLAENSRGKSASSEVLNCLKPIIKSHSQLTRIHCVRYVAHCWTKFDSCSSVQNFLFFKCHVLFVLL